ncbi:MAG: hypothetical protein ACFCUT_18510 [Kiloniellaceae bacterium]
MDDKGIGPGDSGRDQDSGKSAIKQFASTTLPLEIGSVTLGDDGHIQCSQEDRPLFFRFSACGIQFEADMASRMAPLRLRANLGKLPFSAESPDARRLARTVMAATDRLRRGHILLSPDHDIVLEGELMPPTPRTPVSVIATAVALILDFKPYLDLLGEAVALRRPPPQTQDGEEPAPAEG